LLKVYLQTYYYYYYDDDDDDDDDDYDYDYDFRFLLNRLFWKLLQIRPGRQWWDDLQRMIFGHY